jgi:phosphoribosyl 1,2-cyclic phosphodiesterase
MRIRFWGTRGSLAKPGPSTVRYGGNTSCVEVRPADGTLIILDCGTGAHDLGRSLMASGERPVRGHLLLTHTHWDHIQGFPFFAPLFIQGNEFDVYAPQGLGQRLEDTLAGQMEYEYFPVTLAQLGATIRYHELVEGTFDLGTVQVITRYLNHPGLAMGYRFEAGSVAVVYATDHEPHSRHQPEMTDSALALPVHREDRRHVEFLAGADLVIHDAQYTLEEYPSKLSWGHSPAELAVDFALAAGVKRLALFHHDPLRDDAALDQLVETCRQRAGGGRLDVFAAAEGQTIELAEREAVAPHAARQPEAAIAKEVGVAAATILLVDDDPDALRAESDPDLRNVPVVLLTAQVGAEDTAAGFAAGVTDYVTKPFKPAYIRARVHTWLLRKRADTEST